MDDDNEWKNIIWYQLYDGLKPSKCSIDYDFDKHETKDRCETYVEWERLGARARTREWRRKIAKTLWEQLTLYACVFETLRYCCVDIMQYALCGSHLFTIVTAMLWLLFIYIFHLELCHAIDFNPIFFLFLIPFRILYNFCCCCNI